MNIALADCNSFFVSCERVFRPHLRNRPVVVLSSNDGCIVARSKEVKRLGIPMSAPYFKYKEELKRHGVIIASSNFTLYSDLSSRVMEVLAEASPLLEIYSIDEAFLAIEHLDEARALRKKVLKWTGIPLSIGIASTKTLAKVASHFAKEREDGVYKIEKHQQEEFLSKLAVDDIWGVGRNTAKKLRGLGITSALDFRKMDETLCRRELGVMGLRMVMELRGEMAFPLEEGNLEPQKGVTCSRSFGKEVTSWEEMGEAIATYISKAAEKVREQGLEASFLQVYLLTNRFQPEIARFSRVGSAFLPVPTDFTPLLIEKAKSIAKPLFFENIPYKKCGVFLGNLTPKNAFQGDLFIGTERREKEEKLMELMDTIRSKDKNAIHFLSEGVKSKRHWKMKTDHISPAYTTSWSDLLHIHI